MRFQFASLLVGSLLTLPAALNAASSGQPLYGDPPDDSHPWAIHDRNRPQPPQIDPGTFSSQSRPGQPPADAVILFDGQDFANWKSTKEDQPVRWQIQDGAMVVTKTGAIQTKDSFGDCQLHVEWAAPREVKGNGQGRGNSGVFLMNRLEVQVLDSYNNVTYADGHAGSMYGVNPPLVKPLNPPGEWQVYDIVFRRPIYRGNQVVDPGYLTVFINGVLVQDHTRIEGPTGHRSRVKSRPFPEKGPLQLQDHGNPVRFRNIWYRPLPPRAVEGGTDGPLTLEATMAKRKELASMIRKDAPTLTDPNNPLSEMYRWMESIEYQKNAAAMARTEVLANQYVAGIEQLTPSQLKTKKDEVKHVRDTFKFMVKFNLLPATFGPYVEVEEIIKTQDWDKKQRP